MLQAVVRSCVVILAIATLGCAHMDDVQTTSLQPRYVRPTPAQRSAEPLVLIYDPRELPDALPLTVPVGLPGATLLGARSLVTNHMRSALESLFEHVTVAPTGGSVAPGTLIGTVHFVDAGLALTPSGSTLVGTLEWSLTLSRVGEPRTLYSWGERTVGTREGAGSFGHVDPTPQMQGALEASLRALLKDMNDKDVIARAAPPAAAPPEGVPPEAEPASAPPPAVSGTSTN